MTSVLIPPVDLAPGMPSRVVTVLGTDITEDAAALVGKTMTFALSDTLDAPGGVVIARSEETLAFDESSTLQIRVPVYTPNAKNWCGDDDWAVLVKTSWGDRKSIRVPAGTGNIALSDLPNVRPLRGREKQWAVTAASVTVTEGGNAGGSVSLSGGVLDFRLTIPRGDWKQPTISSGSLNDLTVQGSYPVNSLSVTNLPVQALGILTTSGTTYPIQEYATWETIPRLFARRWTGSAWAGWAQQTWRTPDVPSGTDFNTLTTPGYSGVVTTSVTNGPTGAGIGLVEVLVLGTGVVQRYTTWETAPRVWLRRGATSGTGWLPWQEQPSPARITGMESRVTALEGKVGGGGSGMKVVPLTMTAPGTPLSTTTDAGSVRWVRRYAHMPRRVRVHVANRNPGNALNGAQLNIAAIRIGAGDAEGGYTGGVVAQSGGTLAADGTETVTPWVTVPSLSDGGYLNVTVSWWGGGGTATLQHNQGGGWTAANTAAAGEATTAAWTRSQTTPLHCWVEAEVPAHVPVIVAQGDSITVGTASADPVGDSWASVYAHEMGALPVILAMHGSTMTHWTAGAPRWSQFGTFDLGPIADAIVTTIGQNDLASAGITSADLTARHAMFMDALRGVFPTQPVYLGEITASNKAAAVEVVRREFNTYRATLPKGERGVIPWGAALATSDDEALRPEYTSDNLHPNTAGQAVMSGVVESVPVTGRVLTSGQVAALAALI